MVEKRPARIWWRKHRGGEGKLIALALITEGPTGHFDIFLYSPGPHGNRRIAEDAAEGAALDAQRRADCLARQVLRHDCSACEDWV